MVSGFKPVFRGHCQCPGLQRSIRGGKQASLSQVPGFLQVPELAPEVAAAGRGGCSWAASLGQREEGGPGGGADEGRGRGGGGSFLSPFTSERVRGEISRAASLQPLPSELRQQQHDDDPRLLGHPRGERGVHWGGWGGSWQVGNARLGKCCAAGSLFYQELLWVLLQGSPFPQPELLRGSCGWVGRAAGVSGR